MLNRLLGVFRSFQQHDDLLTHEITIFKDRVRIDVQTSTPGLSFKEAWDHRQTMSCEGQQFYVVSHEDLIRSQRAAGRDIGLSDVRLLESSEPGGVGETGADNQQ